MHIFLKLINGQDVTKITNYVYKEKQTIKVSIFPIPEWLQNPICETCGHNANFLLKNMSPICHSCLDKILKGLVTLEKHDDISTPVTMNLIQSLRFEWSTDNERWYSLSGRNIKPLDVNKFLKDFKSAILSNGIINCNAEYSKETKEMKIF